MRAAEEIAAYIEETDDAVRDIAISLYGRQNAEKRVHKILAWRKAGHPEGTTPFTMADANGSKPTAASAKYPPGRVLIASDHLIPRACPPAGKRVVRGAHRGPRVGRRNCNCRPRRAIKAARAA